MFRSVILATATLVLAAQTPAPDAPKPATPETAPAAKAAKAPAAAPKGAPKAAQKAAPKPADEVLARVGKDTIRQSDFEMFLNTTLSDQQRIQLQFVDGMKDQYLTRFLEFKVLAAKARKDGLQNQPEHAKKLAIMDMQLLIQALMERDGPALQAKLNLKDEDVKAFFDAHPEHFKTPETFSARHILVGTKGNGDQKGLTDEEALAKAIKIQGEIKAGKSFADAAKEYSDDPGSKDKGGLYEDTAFGKFVPEFDQAVRAQAVGQLGNPVKTMFGYHLIQVEKITPAVAQTFEASKDTAKEQATAERQEQVMRAYLEQLKKELGYQVGPAGKAKPVAAKVAQEGK